MPDPRTHVHLAPRPTPRPARPAAHRPPVRRACAVALVATLAAALPVAATNGYFTHGYGSASKGLAGAGVALPQDALAAATNPAGMALVGKRYDAGVSFFNPNRRYSIAGAPSGAPGTFGLAPGSVESDATLFEIPYFGLNRRLGERASLGLSLYAQGGMNTTYPTGSFYGSNPTGVDLAQLFFAPTYARRLGRRHAVGVAPILAFQRFEIRGVQAFAPFSAAPEDLTNNGHDESFGYGVKVGYLGRLTERLSVGAAYQSRIRMAPFDRYAGLFADGGDFDIPESWTVGLAFRATPAVTVLLDVQQINYSDIEAVGNPLFPNLLRAPLGRGDGPGFGWRDMTVYKAGVQWQAAPAWTLRAGFSSGDQPIPESEVFFNILAPGVIEEHATLGLSRTLASGRAVNLALMHAFSSSVRGANPLEVPGGQQIELEMDQWELDVSYSWGF